MFIAVKLLAMSSMVHNGCCIAEIVEMADTLLTLLFLCRGYQFINMIFV